MITTLTRRKKPATDFNIRYAIVQWKNNKRNVIREGFLENPVMARLWFDDFVIHDVIKADKELFTKNQTVFFYLDEKSREKIFNKREFCELIEQSVNIHLEFVKFITHIGIIKKPWKITNKKRLVNYHGPGMYFFDPSKIMYNWHTLVSPLYLIEKGMMTFKHPFKKNIMYALKITHLAPHLRKTIKNN